MRRMKKVKKWWRKHPKCQSCHNGIMGADSTKPYAAARESEKSAARRATNYGKMISKESSNGPTERCTKFPRRKRLYDMC